MTDDDVATLPYEKALARLDELIARLERGDVDLEEMVGCYEEGARLAQRCAELLDRTEQRVTQLVVGAGGVQQERAFRPEAAVEADADAGAPLRARPARAPASDLFPGLDPAPGPGAEPGRGRPVDIDPDDIPF